MPGIVGIIGLNKSISHFEKEFQDILGTLIYNEDDLVKIIKNKKHILGVVNIDDGRKIPKYFTNHDRTIECLIDGDVFINEEIKKQIGNKFCLPITSHWQIFVPYLFQVYKEELTRYLKGWFNLIIVDNKEKKYHVLNSRFGMRPLYYAEANGYFIFSSELKSFVRCSLIKKEINKKALIEFALFNYPIGKDTFLANVFLLNPATFITIKNSQVFHSIYWTPESLISDNLLPFEESLEGAEVMLKNAVNEMSRDQMKVGISLTGGFDGRTILSLTDKKKENLLLYSFGVSESEDIRIPKKISKQLSYNYFPIYLDNNYGCELFNKYAKKTILFSDGRSSLARAHYLYAFDLLSREIKVALTGICGSELVRAVRVTGEVISKNLKLIFLNDDSIYKGTIFKNLQKTRYYNQFIIDIAKPSILESIKAIKLFNNSRFKLNQKFYIFLMKEVLRKYYGTEISMESPFLYNRFPYLDYDFVDFIFKTPFCGANYDFFVQNPFIRQKGQFFHSYIINRNNKTLAKISINRMLYSPHDLLTNRGKIKAGLAYCYGKIFKKRRDEYNLIVGLKHFMSQNTNFLKENEFVNVKNIIEDFNSGAWRKNRIEFYNAVSFAFWYNYYFR
ncbi:MAG TPA: hypothetical protein ENI51_07460 [Candidatus Atribacteria bacterium]|nr:hypothetical protein [Candidatus Atribacteria bacterium]